jgi:hypothetical protein
MIMEKKIQDFLHLYLGCDAQVAVIVPGQELSWEPDKLNIRWLHGSLNKLVEVKPILRPLSDMTVEEAIELAKLSEWEDHFNEVETKRTRYDDIVVTWQGSNEGREEFNATGNVFYCSDQFQWLLSNHFDLFHLIEDGLALDKSTLKQPG